MLVITLQDNLTWGAHIETSEDALLPSVRKKVGIMKHIGRNIPARSKKLLVEGIILSKLRYLITVWCGTTDNYLKSAQIVLNDAARYITGRNRRTNST